jgi:signal transduction histidine kinase
MHDDTIAILLVDDEPRNLDALQAVLDEPSYRLLRAENADRALHLLLENDVAAIVMDIKMPGVSGFELAKMIKGTKKFREIPIVLLTAYLLDDKDILTGYGAGAVDYLTKPVNPSILRHKVAAFADLFRKTRALAELNDTLEARVQERMTELAKSEAARRETESQFRLAEAERQLLREQLARAASDSARQEMERVSRAKDEFLATMSHELRTPLNAIMGWASILRKRPRGRDEEKLDRGLEVIERNSKALTRLVGDLLDVSRIISGKLQLALVRTEVFPVVIAAVDVVRAAAEGKGVALLVDVDADMGATMADEDRVQQVVWNLLSNAIRFTPRGGRVTVSCHRTSRGIVLRVEDTGAGIAPEHLPHIFDRFMQVDSSATRAHGGLGLGLAIVRHLVEAHGGSVEAASDGLGKGAAFTVTLPIRAVNTAGEPVEVADTNGATEHDREEPPSGVDSRLEQVRALVVDDDRDSIDLLRVVLEGAGARVTTATSAREALAILEGLGPFDVLVSDIAMPEMDGCALLREIRSRAQGAELPAIALTAYARKEDADRVKRAGYDQHLSKPVDEARLLEAVKAWSRTGKRPSARPPGRASTPGPS